MTRFQPRARHNLPSASRDRTHRALHAVAVLACFALCACGKTDGKQAATQVVAIVNGQEISIHQLDDATAGQPAPPQGAEALRRRTLEKLIDQKLVLQQAAEHKLDRSPEVISAIEAAKQDIIARAYLKQLVAAVPQPTNDDAIAYYSQNPALFSQRRVYSLQEILLANDGAPPPEQLQRLAATKTIEQIAAWLEQHEIKFAANTATRTTDEIPLELVPKLGQLGDGQIGVFALPQAISIVRVVASRTASVAESDARPKVQQFLANQRAEAAVAADLQRLRAAAKIDYAGVSAAAGRTAAANVATPIALSTPNPAAVPNLEKSVSGLK